MTISTERLQEMLAAAEKATPGPWQLLNVGDGRRAKAPADEVGISLLTIVSEGEVDFAAVYEDADAAHIDNCDPDTIRELITELLASRSGVEGREAGLEEAAKWLDSRSAEIEAIIATDHAAGEGIGLCYGDCVRAIGIYKGSAFHIRTLKDNTHGA